MKQEVRYFNGSNWPKVADLIEGTVVLFDSENKILTISDGKPAKSMSGNVFVPEGSTLEAALFDQELREEREIFFSKERYL